MMISSGKENENQFGIEIPVINNHQDENDNEVKKNNEGGDDTTKDRSASVVSWPDDPPDTKYRSSILLFTDSYIIVTEFCERLAYYGFAGSLILFMQIQLGYTNAQSDIQYSYWSGVCYVTPLIGGYLADTYLNRYRTILLFGLIYVAGLVMIVIAANPNAIDATLVFAGMYVVAIGTGGIKPNVSTLGADQFDERYSRDRKEKESFFNWFYWAINLGALISYTLVAYICQYGLVGLGGLEWGFFAGYMIPTVMMAVAMIIFVIGTPKYKVATPAGSVFSTCAYIVNQAIYKNTILLFTRKEVDSREGNIATTRDQLEAIESGKASELSSKHGDVQSSAAVPVIGFFDRARQCNGGSYTDIQVDCVQLVARLIPFLFTMIPYWGIYSQMSTAFQNQGCQMQLNGVPISMLNIFDTIAILALLPIFDRVVYPYFAKIGRPLTMLQKIGAGFVFAAVAMLVAALVEEERIKYTPAAGDYYDVNARNNITPCQSIDNFNPYNYQLWFAGDADVSQPAYCSQTCSTMVVENGQSLLSLSCISCNDIPQMSNISVFWQIPQFMLIGISEILASITALEFFYSQSPTAMRSVVQSFNLLTTSLGSFIIIPLIYLVNSNPNNEWITSNLNDGHLSYYFLVLATLMMVDLVWFAWLGQSYEYKTTAELQIEKADFELGDASPENPQIEDVRLSQKSAGLIASHSFVSDIDPHTGHVVHMDPLTGSWTHKELSEEALHKHRVPHVFQVEAVPTSTVGEYSPELVSVGGTSPL